jgi:8-oxo-dGTP pyrophosphatase MutT (NUDIX family)
MKKSEDDRKWDIISTEYLIRRPWLTARRDCVRLPNGRVNDEFYVLEYPDWINVIAVTTDGDMVMVRQYRHGLQRTSYELCAGVIEQGETPEQAARRELAEETGYTGGEWREYMVLSANPSTSTNLTHSFLAVGVSKTEVQHLDETEDITVHLFTPDQLVELLQSGEIVQALMAAPLWKYFMQHNHHTSL